MTKNWSLHCVKVWSLQNACLAEQRWQLLLEAEKRINEVTYYKEQAERISEERMQAFRDTEEMVRSRDQALSEAERIIQMLKEQLESVSKQNSNQ